MCTANVLLDAGKLIPFIKQHVVSKPCLYANVIAHQISLTLSVQYFISCYNQLTECVVYVIDICVSRWQSCQVPWHSNMHQHLRLHQKAMLWLLKPSMSR